MLTYRLNGEKGNTKLQMDKLYTQKIDEEIDDAFETVGIIVRAKIERLCNEKKFIEAQELENALIIINNTDYHI